MSVQVLPPEVEAHVRPEGFNDGEPVTVELSGLKSLGGQRVSVIVHAVTAVDTGWLATIPLQLDTNGDGSAELTAGITVGQAASVYVGGIATQDGQNFVFPEVAVSIANPTSTIATLEDARLAHERLIAQQNALYARPLGDPGSPGNREHRVLCIIEGLYMTTRMRLPGAAISPVSVRPGASEERAIINDLLTQENFTTQLPEPTWRTQAEARSPLTMITCPEVWATDYAAAGELVRDLRDRVIALMAMNRNATGRPLCMVIEQRQPNDGVVSKWALESQHYIGNLAGGIISGENQHDLLRQTRAIEVDPLLKLCCNLYGEALGERSEDARYLRLWSILEFLSGARLPANDVVTLRDGSPWPNRNANTTRVAAPRVYRYLAEMLDQKHIDESSFVSPAANLYEAVRVWYARRNATGHYGRLVVGDSAQMAQNWYPLAIQSLVSSGIEDSWSRTLQQSVAASIDHEIGKVSLAP